MFLVIGIFIVGVGAVLYCGIGRFGFYFYYSFGYRKCYEIISFFFIIEFVIFRSFVFKFYEIGLRDIRSDIFKREIYVWLVEVVIMFIWWR